MLTIAVGWLVGKNSNPSPWKFRLELEVNGAGITQTMRTQSFTEMEMDGLGLR